MGVKYIVYYMKSKQHSNLKDVCQCGIAV